MIFRFLKRLLTPKPSEAELALERAYHLGEEAYEMGGEVEDNPFPHVSPLFAAWEDGFEDMLWNRLGLK